MDRATWLKEMRVKTETLYDRFAPLYWRQFGFRISEAHVRYLLKFLRELAPGSTLLSAGCGAGKYDGILLEAGHSLVGIDMSEGMLSRARSRFPRAQYIKMGLQEMDFQQAFDGATCIDALEHVFPEDWPVILLGFQRALKPGGVLYFTLDVSAADELDQEYERAKLMGLPVVYGEVVADLEEAFEMVMSLPEGEVPGEEADRAVYHFYPPATQVRAWLKNEGFEILAEEMGNEWYRHFLVRKAAKR